jgi:Fe2+ or Zn2+ uptake regulation protein
VLYAALAGTNAHPSAEELFDAVRRREPGISLATVYNTLEAFTAAGLCRVIPGPSAARFDADTSDHVHVHTAEGRVIDLPADLGRRLLDGVDPTVLREVEAALGMPIASVRLELHSPRIAPA